VLDRKINRRDIQINNKKEKGKNQKKLLLKEIWNNKNQEANKIKIITIF